MPQNFHRSPPSTPIDCYYWASMLGFEQLMEEGGSNYFE